MNPSPPENTRRFSLPAPQRVQVVVFCQPGTASIPGSCCFGGGRHSVAMKLQRRLSVKRRFQATSLCHHEAAGTINLKSLKLSQLPFSILLIFDWLKPTIAPSCSCDKPRCRRNARIRFQINYITSSGLTSGSSLLPN